MRFYIILTNQITTNKTLEKRAKDCELSGGNYSNIFQEATAMPRITRTPPGGGGGQRKATNRIDRNIKPSPAVTGGYKTVMTPRMYPGGGFIPHTVHHVQPLKTIEVKILQETATELTVEYNKKVARLPKSGITIMQRIQLSMLGIIRARIALTDLLFREKFGEG